MERSSEASGEVEMASEGGEGGLYRSSLAKDPESEFVPQSQLLDPSSFTDKTVPAFDERDYQSKCSGGGVVPWSLLHFGRGVVKIGIVHGKV